MDRNRHTRTAYGRCNRSIVIERLKGKKPVLFWSGGLDSTLLLARLRKQPYPFDIVQIRDFWTKEQLKRADSLIKKWNLQVFSYPAAAVSLIGQGDDLTAVFEYAVGTARIPMLRDVIKGERCIAELQGMTMQMPPMDWNLFLVGSRRDDKHYAMDKVIPSESWQIGGVEFYAPLFEMTRAEVIAELKMRGLDADEVDEQVDGGNLALCSNCLNGVDAFCPKENKVIPPVDWSRERNLENFREAYYG